MFCGATQYYLTVLRLSTILLVMSKHFNERNREIVAKRRAGFTLREIAKIYNLCHQRISQILKAEGFITPNYKQRESK